MSKHTPGPWKRSGVWIDQSVGVAASSDPMSASVATIIKRKEFEANARLIAAAPEMLAALYHVRDHCLKHPDQLVDQAIAKAEGGS